MTRHLLDAVLVEYLPHAIDRALTLIREDWQESGATIPLPLGAFLAERWHEAKWAKCWRLAEEGHLPPPVSAVGLRIMRRTLYSLTDGNHRVMVRRQRGGTHIVAKLAGSYTCDPSRFLIDHDHVWKISADGRTAQMVWEVGEEQEAILVKLGVRRV